MTAVLEVNGLCKAYPSFKLDNVGFSIEAGHIMGFIGRNGAGKTTTLKCLLDLAHPSAGDVRFFGLDARTNQTQIKQRIGYVVSTAGYHQRKRIQLISEVTKTFYPTWDEDAYRHYLDVFGLDEGKSPRELSEGMKVKYSIALALSHRAELLILDEPTSGLDPISRDELLMIFEQLAEKGVAILFSTHITSDLDKCAHDVTYIKEGKIIYTGTREGLGMPIEDYMLEHERREIHV
ncbi:MAG: ABC transporter ATP-binding protein [bacterium]|nr:ABC transporter ATP-binding protein [bacterium]